MKKNLSYAASGVNYQTLDAIKRLAQQKAQETVSHTSIKEIPQSRGESAYVWEEKDCFKAFVIEGLGTKNLIADEMRKITNKTYYEAIAQDTVAMIVNDVIVVGAKPEVINAYFAVGDSNWFLDEERAHDLINGWAKACKKCRAVWGGGETPTLRDIVYPSTIELAGSVIGTIRPKKRLTLGSKLQANDVIVLIESNGIHANGLTLVRKIGKYGEKLADGQRFGEALLQPTHLYASLVQNLFEEGVDIHYMVNITGHGWRKLMRAQENFSYIVEEIPEPQPLFRFIQDQSGNDDQEMYGNFNMGAGFAILLPEKYGQQVKTIAKKHGLQSWIAGYLKKGKKQVVIKPKTIVFESETLAVR